MGKNGNLDSYLWYELAPWPLSMFENGVMRKNTKSLFYDNFDALTETPTLMNAFHVVDGDYFSYKCK